MRVRVYLYKICELGGVGGGVDAKYSRVAVGVVVGRGAVHPVVPVQHVRVKPEKC